MGLFSRRLPETTIEVLCQNTGRTFRIYTSQARKSVTCRACGRETFVVSLGSGHGNVSVLYIAADETQRNLKKVEVSRHTKLTLATASADGGTFILVSQEE